MIYNYTYESCIGALTLSADENAITALRFGRCGENAKNELISLACGQLDEYFAGSRKEFDLPLNPSGTEFQKNVWRKLCDIPYGSTRTYGQIAEAVGNKKACRAVGMANNRNPIAIIIPCHRVIGSGGKLTGYAGGLEIKKFLLELENKNK